MPIAATPSRLNRTFMGVGMKTRVFVAVALISGLAWAAPSPLRALSTLQKTDVADSGTIDARAIVNQYCVGCHSQRTKAGGLALDTLDWGAPSAHAEVLEKVVRKLRGGVMPPPGRPRPDPVTYDRLIRRLETDLDQADPQHP